MKLKLSQMLAILPALNALSSRAALPIKPGYWIAKATNLISTEVKIYDDQRLRLAAELGVKSEDGSTYVFSDENRPIFNSQIDELLAVEIELPIHPISVTSLGDSFMIEPAHLGSLIDTILVE